MKTLAPIKLSALAVYLAFSTTSITATAMESGEIHGWESPLAAEFVKLDTTGNGLVMPNEASRGKAFNKKTFAQADIDNDGTIDQKEYIKYRGGEQASTASNNAMPNDASQNGLEDNNALRENATQDNVVVADNANQDSANKDRSVGLIIDDSVITTKVKAKILATEDLKSLQISVKTLNGEVSLTGLVETEAAKMKAEEVVKNVAGVKSVINSLEVKG